MTGPTMLVYGIEYPLGLSVPQTAELLGGGRDATYAAVKNGSIPHYRVGRSIRVPLLEVLRILGFDVTPDTSELVATGSSPPTEVAAPEGTATKVESTGQMEAPRLSVARDAADLQDQSGAA